MQCSGKNVHDKDDLNKRINLSRAGVETDTRTTYTLSHNNLQRLCVLSPSRGSASKASANPADSSAFTTKESIDTECGETCDE